MSYFTHDPSSIYYTSPRPLTEGLPKNNYTSDYYKKDTDTDTDPNIFIYADSVLENLMEVLTFIADCKYAEIRRGTLLAHDTQEMANRVDIIIAEATKGDDKTKETLPDDVIRFMKDHGITVNGVSIDKYIKQHGGTLDKGELQAVKAALDSASTRGTDLMSQGQLTLQKIAQQLNSVLTATTNLLSKWGDLLSMIAQKMF